MKIVKINEKIFFNVEDFTSCEYENSSYDTPSGGYVSSNFSGSVITLKNGRKIYVNKIHPDDVLKKVMQVINE